MKSAVLILVLCVTLAGCTAGRGQSGSAASSAPAKEVDLRLSLAESHISNQQPQLALQELLQVESAAKGLPRYHFALGMVFMSLEEMERAEKSFVRAVELDPAYGEAWNNLGKVQESMGHDSQAETSYRTAFQILTYLTPELPAYNMGVMYLRTNRTKEAEQFARKSLARNWSFMPAYKLLADTLVAQNRLEDAEAALQRGLEADLNNVSMMLALGEHQVRMGKNAEAREWFERIIAGSPKSHEAKMARDYLVLLQ